MTLTHLTRIPSIMFGLLLGSACEKGGSGFSVLSSTNQFEQTSTYVPRKLDVLFVVDNSGSMQSSQASLAVNFPSFINFFKTKGYDFKIAVTTTDAYYGDQFVNSGCGSLCSLAQTRFRSGVNPNVFTIDRNTANLESVFAANVNVGTGGSGDERAFSSFRAALNSSLNAGFHRSDAYLSVVIVSDEEDFSHNTMFRDESYTQPDLHSVASYKTFLQDFTSGVANSDFSVSIIAVLDEACRLTLSGGQKIATRYMQLADLTGGSKNSICNSFDQVLNNVSQTLATQTQPQFVLSRRPVPSSLRVMVGGVLVNESLTNGWSYDAVSNSVLLYGGAVPASGSIVTINFDPASVN